MTDAQTPTPEQPLPPESAAAPQPGMEWPFTQSELAAGLRRHTGDPILTVTGMQGREICRRRPAVGKLRGLKVQTTGSEGEQTFELVLKQTHGSTRVGAAGAGLREKSIYLTLKEHLPLHLPDLIAAHPKGEWLVLSQLPSGRRPEKWTAADYLLATEQLAVLHDRFWGLDVHLAVYPWLEQPVESSREIYQQAARTDAALLAKNTSGVLNNQTDILPITEKIIQHLDTITEGLRDSPATLLHGDYWPGNILIEPNSRLTVFDWEDAAIGPAVLDLLGFLQGSSWHFSPLPIASSEIIAHYRSRLSSAGAHSYTNQEFEQIWDFAVMWTFVGGWVGRLAKAPEPILPMRLAALEEMVFSPLRQALDRQFN